MAKVVVLAKRRAWRDLKRMVASGRILRPPKPEVKPPQPQSDAALALAYMVEGLKRRR